MTHTSVLNRTARAIGGVGNYRKFGDEAKASGYAGFELESAHHAR